MVKCHLCTIKTKFTSWLGNFPCNLTSPSNSVSKLHVGGKDAKNLANVCLFGRSKGNVRRNDKVTVLTIQGFLGWFRDVMSVHTSPKQKIERRFNSGGMSHWQKKLIRNFILIFAHLTKNHLFAVSVILFLVLLYYSTRSILSRHPAIRIPLIFLRYFIHKIVKNFTQRWLSIHFTKWILFAQKDIANSIRVYINLVCPIQLISSHCFEHSTQLFLSSRMIWVICFIYESYNAMI